MIACLGKNNRGRPLFEALAALDPRYVDLGSVGPSRRVHIASLLCSATANMADTKREARFSPSFLAGSAAACAKLLESQTVPVEAVLYWGATNVPVGRSDTPYAVVTDGPFDPDDPAYPAEWKPKRWGKEYLATQRKVFEQARHIFTLSEWARQKVVSVHHQNPKKVTKCGWGPLGCFYPPRFEASDGTKLILSVGSDWRRKGMDLVADAGTVLHTADPSIHTVIVGVPGDMLIKARPGVSLLPHNTPPAVVHTLLRAASVMLIAARFDASPHVIYEALQYGTPVVGTGVCGVPEAIDPPHGGMIAEANASSIIDAVRYVFLGDERIRRTQAFETFQRSGGWQRSAKIVQSILSDQGF